MDFKGSVICSDFNILEAGVEMGIIVQSLFLVLVGLASVMVCGGSLALLCRLVPLLDRQRVALRGVGE